MASLQLTAYTFSLVAHSYLRWALLAIAVASVARALHGWGTDRAWGPGDERLASAFVGAADLQLALGLVLYLWLSPITDAAWRAPSAVMEQPVLRFFALLHPTVMFVGITALHVGRVKSRRASAPREKHRLFAAASLAWLVAACAAIPWPGLAFARPLFR